MVESNPTVEVNLKPEKKQSAERDFRIKVKNHSEDSTMFKQVIRCLRYLCKSRPDICFVKGLVSKFMKEPRKSHMNAARRVVRYIAGTLEFGILFPTSARNARQETIFYSDADWCGDQIDRRSTTEYIAGSYAACQALWIESVLKELKVDVERSIKLQIDNKSAIYLVKNLVLHGRSKHIEARFHFLREQVNQGSLDVEHCATGSQVADILTRV
ncbi:unnamed protein product [Trifolium pratense]|uniref:Uncharacterized protein n=1 Tax=Trifolium pratense TaxID=57577 RepID=A0ACB0JI19_TRIPR|nr:unnamed protein product [Trifolium pratense]